MIYDTPQLDFDSKFDYIQCFIEHEREFLYLLRQDDKEEGNKWGGPGGGSEQGEDKLATAIRETKEETGILLCPQRMIYLGVLYVRYPERFDFTCHTYYTVISRKPKIVLNDEEHKDFRWVTLQEALSLDLMLDEDEHIRIVSKILGFKHLPQPGI